MSRGAGESCVFFCTLVGLSSVVEFFIVYPFLDEFLSVETFLMLVLIPDAVLGKEGMETESR